MDCGRLTLQGVVEPVPEADKARLREIFLKKYPSVRAGAGEGTGG